MKLPPGAVVLSVVPGEWSGDGTIYFRLPKNHTPDYWMEKIINDNAPEESPSPSHHVKEKHQCIQSIQNCYDNGDNQLLDYDSEKDTFKFIILGNQ